MTTVTANYQGSLAHKPSFLKKYRGTILFLAFLALVAYGSAALTPSIFGDEWGVLSNYLNDRGPFCPEWGSARPFASCWGWLVFRIFGVNFYAFHAVALIMSFLSALLLLITLDILLPDWAAFNGAVAAIFLVFPADMTRTFLAGNVVYGNASYLVAACFLAAFWRSGRWWTWIIGMLMLIFALGTYETGVGITMALAGIAFVFAGHRTRLERLALLAPAFVAGLFSIWRWMWQQTAEGAFGYDSGGVSFSPRILLDREIVGIKYLLQQAWTDTILNLVPELVTHETISRIPALLVLLGLVFLPIAVAYLLTRSSHQEVETTGRGETTSLDIMDLVKAGAVGFIILIFGYLPIILVQFPGDWYAISRTHHLPSIGGALVICSVIFGLSFLLSKEPKRTRIIALAGIIPLLILGVMGQLFMHQQTRRAWADQTKIWTSLFEQAPDIVDGTHVLFMLNEYNSSVVPIKGPGPFIQGDWGMNNAIRTLYGKDNLYAHFGIGWPPRVLSADGETLVVSDFGIREFPAASTLVFVFGKNDRELVQMHVLEKDGQTLQLGPGRILNDPATGTEWRRLVGVTE